MYTATKTEQTTKSAKRVFRALGLFAIIALCAFLAIFHRLYECSLSHGETVYAAESHLTDSTNVSGDTGHVDVTAPNDTVHPAAFVRQSTSDYSNISVSPAANNKHDQRIRNLTNHGNSTKTKLILLWNLMYVPFSPGSTEIKPVTCPTWKCGLTIDKSRLPQADAVVFNGLTFGASAARYPAHTRPDQIFVFHVFESPLVANQQNWLSKLQNIFNMTFSYLESEDTDITFKILLAVRREKPLDVAPPPALAVKSKSKMAAWAVSNCHSKSVRWEYAKELSKHIPVDIFGDCGNLSCSRDDNSCFDHISREYWFYLSFENSWCVDYITEKVFRPLRILRLVPVILGGANYTKYLPPKSFIFVGDYESPYHLAQHLIYLRNNVTAYLGYFEWTKDYTFGMGSDGFCRLCRILHSEVQDRKTIDPKQYWDPDKWCIHGDEERIASHLSHNRSAAIHIP